MIQRVCEISENKIPVIIYGAGEQAHSQIENLSELFHISFFWDANTEKQYLCGHEIRRPFEGLDELEDDPIILVTIEKVEIRKEVIDYLALHGFNEVYYSGEILRILDELKKQSNEENLTKLIESFPLYKCIEPTDEYVNYSIVRKEWENNKGKFSCIEDLEQEQLVSAIKEKLIIDDYRLVEAVSVFVNSIRNNPDNCYVSYELFLRKLLSGGVKTKYRPLRMVGDDPYDPFAVYEVQNAVLTFLTKNDLKSILRIVEELIGISYEKRYLEAIRCRLLTEAEKYHEALIHARKLVRKNPTSFFENEIFYKTAIVATEAGIRIEEKLPPRDLTDRFCWSGMNYVWCGGKDKDGSPLLAPCFRAVECAVRPTGDFSDGEDWKLFRDSIVDGSFRYCQKSQCPNIIGGWLPRKSECTHPDIKMVLEKDRNQPLAIEELHLSYDKHCNLKCPSCRTKIYTNTTDDNRCLDDFYSNNLAPIVAHARHLCLSGCGEALLSPHSKKILTELPGIAAPDLKVELRTNMTVLNQRTWESIGDGRRYIRHIAASIDGCTKETFEKLRYPAKWGTVLDNLSFVSELRRNHEIDLFEFHVVMQRDNIDELYDIAMLAIRLGADVVTYSKFVNWMGLDEETYAEVNPFWMEHPRHADLMREIDRLKGLRQRILSGDQIVDGGKPFYINIHYEDDPGRKYEPIRYGKLKIR